MRAAHSLVVITRNENMRDVLSRAGTIAASDSSVLLIGETGVGKELFADFIHRTSPRSDRPFVKIALSAMPIELLESELFGHEKGSFTNATSEKRGLFELAHTGTLFLDDIDDVPLPIQTKLLRVLESQEVMRVGGTSTIPIDVRLISASKVDLRQLVSRGLFRNDLFYRINVVPVEIPSLRERREDIPLLVRHFLDRFAPGKQISVTPEAERALMGYNWPGNVRELRNITQRMVLFAEGEIRLRDLPPEFRNGAPIEAIIKACSQCFRDDALTFSQIVSCLEINLLRQALKDAGGNRTQASKALGLNLSTLRDKLKKYGLENGSHD